MARDSGFQPNRSFMQQLAVSPGVSRVVQAAGRRGQAWAESNAPARSGTYRESFAVVAGMVTVSGKKRAGANLVNRATRQQGGSSYPYAWAVEWGRGGKHVLQRAIDVIEKG